ncbi:hypothetical protein [Candidatus Uabimicrobium amorphum]|uniref:Uncharacterized protein n=1 Tax=Uabimicrobium amorphum TaxID=2596890 RepID=A0A5S9ISA5_UABAM|nr:hypothetical protein [Candidatus Uabimicrobium amorphum]BBM86240.1 hypothetical protein UABAM_04626 [Candidatus Uabimicrobium amorphum]
MVTRIISVILLVLLFTSCAEVSVRKVPTPTQYTLWTDEMQKEADNMQGFRFYLPRPFINVFESFPVRTDIYIATGKLVAETGNPNKKYVLINTITDKSGLSQYINGDLSMGQDFLNELRQPAPIDTIQQDSKKDPKKENTANADPANADSANANADPANADSANANADPANADSAKTDDKSTGLPFPGYDRTELPKLPSSLNPEESKSYSPYEPESPKQEQPTTGINRQSVSNNNAAFAYQPLRGNFDIVYLPDFEEQYAISSQSGLGNAQFAVNFGQGWSLQSFNSLSDNSELNKRVFDLIDTSISAAKSAVTGLPPGTEKAISGIPQLNTDEKSLGGLFAKTEGTPVTLKFVVVHYAAKGLYPVLKPRELQKRIHLKDKVDTSWLLTRLTDTSKTYAYSEYKQEDLKNAIKSVDSENFTVPRYPYQYISFNTFRYMAVEVVESSSSEGNDPFKNLYDSTGTKFNLNSQARLGEITHIIRALTRNEIQLKRQQNFIEYQKNVLNQTLQNNRSNGSGNFGVQSSGSNSQGSDLTPDIDNAIDGISGGKSGGPGISSEKPSSMTDDLKKLQQGEKTE